MGGGAGSRADVVVAFKARWNLDMAAEKQLRTLSHKDLRYVMDKYDGEMPLEELINDAAHDEPDEDEETTVNAMPGGPGVKTMGRFNRLELIDPLADCAVFGDANLTVSTNLAKHRKDLGHVGRVIATTFEEIDTLRERYHEIDSSVKLLEEHHAEVYHGVDCTRIAIDPRFEGMEGKLGALRSFVKPGGVVKVSSNSGAVGVRYSYIVGGAVQNEFVHVETMPFLEWR